MASLPDHYGELGIPKDADADAIKKAYRTLALLSHPDKNPGDKAAEERFKRVAEAYATLSDAEKRRQYDQIRNAPASSGPAQFMGRPAGAHAPFNASPGFSLGEARNIFDALFGGHDPFADFTNIGVPFGAQRQGGDSKALTNGASTGTNSGSRGSWDVKITKVKRPDGTLLIERTDSRTGQTTRTTSGQPTSGPTGQAVPPALPALGTVPQRASISEHPAISYTQATSGGNVMRTGHVPGSVGAAQPSGGNFVRWSSAQ
jgi:DnaJ-class molecular chaperone